MIPDLSNLIATGLPPKTFCYIWFFTPSMKFYIPCEIRAVRKSHMSNQGQVIFRRVLQELWRLFHSYILEGCLWAISQ
jgi:hypothetical protein